MENCQQGTEGHNVDADPVTLHFKDSVTTRSFFPILSWSAVSFSAHCSVLPHLS